MELTRTRLLEICLDATERFKKINKIKEVREKTDNSYAAKKTRIARAINSCGSTSVACSLRIIVEELLEDNLPVLTSDNTGKYKFVDFACLVPTGNNSEHNYPIGRVAIVCVDDTCLTDNPSRSTRGSCSTGNHIDHSSDTVRVATEEEIKERIGRIVEAELDFLSRRLPGNERIYE